MSKPFHGHKVLGHMSQSDGTIVVLIDRGPGPIGRYMTGDARTLQDPEWYWGVYTDNLNDAARNMLERVGMWAGTTTC